MVPRFGCYATYRDSGVEWLGHIPAHWEVRRLKACATVHLSNVDKKSREGESEVLLCNYVDVYYHERIEGEKTFMAATATPDQIRRFSLRKGDVLVTKDSETWTDIAVPALVDEDLSGVLCGYHLALIRPGSHVSGGFLARALSAIGPRDQFHVAANGITRFGLTADAIRGGVIALPPLSEQRAIAAFLDRETGRVDALLTNKKELIRQLREKRTALVSHAVTRGLDPDAPMKESGVAWLGKIPTRWDVRRLKHLAAFKGGGTPAKHVARYWSGNIPWVSAKDMRSDVITDTIDHITPEAVRASSTRLVDEGAVLVVVRSGILRHRIPVAIAQRRVALNQDLKALVSYGDVAPRYLAYLLTGMGDVLLVKWRMQGATVESLETRIMATTRFPVPAIAEQRAIADYLDRETGRIDGLIAKVEEGIERLREYRTALISAAVTGQIDVRGAHDGSSVADVEAASVSA